MDDSLENSTNPNSTGVKCMPFTKDEPMDSTLVKAACYSVIMLISLLGNTALIAIVARYKHMQTTTSLLIANMAISDLMVSAFAVPRELAQIFTSVQRRDCWSHSMQTCLFLPRHFYRCIYSKYLGHHCR